MVSRLPLHDWYITKQRLLYIYIFFILFSRKVLDALNRHSEKAMITKA